MNPIPPGWEILNTGRRFVAEGTCGDDSGDVGEVLSRLIRLYCEGEYLGQRKRALAVLSAIGNPTVTEYFLKMSESASPALREKAVFALSEFSDEDILIRLRNFLGDPEASVRAAACIALGNCGDLLSTDLLVKRLKDVSGKVRRCAAEALGLLKDSATIPALLEALDDLGIAVRKRAAEALGGIASPDVLDTLSKRLLMGDVSERWNAAEVLADWQMSSAVSPLAAAVHDASSKVRKRVAYALGSLPFPNVVKPLGELLCDDSVEVRGRAIYGLGKTGLKGAGSLLLGALTVEDRLIRKRVVDSLVSWVTEVVSTSTGEDEELMKVRRALENLAAEGDDELRYYATFGLAILREPSSLKGVEEALQSQDVVVRRKAMEVLTHSGQLDHLKFILERLMDTDPSVRKAAAVALGTFGLESSGDLKQESIIEDALSKALEDEVARVSEAACESWYCRKERWENMKP